MTATPPRLRRLVLLVAAVALAAGGCSSKSPSSATARPTTPARLSIVSPMPNEVTKPDLTIQLKLDGAEVVPTTTGPLRPDQGHVHVSVDGQLVSMAFGTSQDLHALAAGTHSLQAEFVATDHAPFRNRVIAGVIFQVQP
ncbi:MAG: hypothetical protein QOI56_528 [Actinomycetota bacterium]|jgi:hypothetical protein|nr:hypothetical protein [Actinomycetota bacterium]